MAGILGRFKDIMSANINALLDKAEDPEKMIDQYLRNMERDLGAVKAETAAVMAEDSAMKRKVIECRDEIGKMEDYARKALQAGNEADARLFLEKKESFKIKLESLQKSSETAAANALKMRQMHDKLTDDVQKLRSRRDEIRAKVKMAKTTEKITSMTTVTRTGGSISAFEAMEEKANRMMDEADAMIELNSQAQDDVEELAKKYDSTESAGVSSSKIDEELEKMKKDLGL
ncbi:MAG: PspA/IM30 family protein [Peptostreptococcaceae bacterium]|nr:PspA/IM30 family protein [Peptostreptococcaceae bacterium]